MAYRPEETAMGQPHTLTLDARKKLTVTGITEVESFDEQMVVLHTADGTLVVRGTGLQLQRLDPEGGHVHVDGTVGALTYEERAAGGFFSRLFG